MSLSIQQLSKVYKGKLVLSDISFEASHGEVLGIVGPNGAGKSTLLRIVSGIIDADQGQVRWNEKIMDIAASGAWGYLPEERGLYPQMKVLDQLIHFAGLKGMSAKEAKSKALELLKEWKMDHYAESQASDLSKGNQQRIQFLACILHDPELIILDEPFSGLDPVQADWLKEQVMLFKQQGKIVLYSSHRMDSVEALCDRVLILHEGKKIAYGTTADLCKQDQEHWKILVRGGDDEWMKIVSVLHVQTKTNEEKHVTLKIQESELGILLLALKKSGAVLESMQRDRLSLHEVFVNLTSDRHVE